MVAGWIGYSAAAATNYWVTTSDTGNWNEPSNWSLAAVPGATDTAVITNAATSGNGYTVEVDQLPANVFRLTCGAPAGQTLTLNIRTNLTVHNTSSSDSDWSLGPQGNVAITIFSNAVLDTSCQILGANVSNNYTILPGGTLKFGSTINKRFRVYGGLTIQGNVVAGSRAGELVNASTLVVDGGYLHATVLSSVPSLLTNNATVSYSSMSFAGATTTMRDGVVTNRAGGALHVGAPATGNAASFLNLSGGLWLQESPAYICERPNGYLNLSGSAQFVSTNHVWVGSNNNGSQQFLFGYSGNVNVYSGAFVITNLGGTATLFLGNITPGYLNCAGGTSVVDQVVLSNRGNVLGSNAVGRITLAGGRLDILKSLSATNGNYSVLVCSTGTLNVANADIATSNAWVIGDGKGSATLGLLAGTHRFADGVVITNLGVLAAGGVGNVAQPSVEGDLTLRGGAALDVDIGSSGYDALGVSGVLSLPSQATVVLRAQTGAALPQTLVLATANAVNAASGLSGWTITPVGEVSYTVSVEGTSLVLNKKQKGTMISIL